MARRRKDKDGLTGVLFDLAAAPPWWVGVALAVLAYVVLHRYAIATGSPPVVPGQMGKVVVWQMLKAAATVGQYVVPLLLLAGAVASAIGRRKRQALIADVAGDPAGTALRTMSWRDFERVVGEAFRMRGYSVTETGGGGADGGIDLKLTQGGETSLVQCKQWRAYKVPVTIVRELYGVMAAQGAAAGFVVTSGVFTAEARSFAHGRNIELIDGAALPSRRTPVRPDRWPLGRRAWAGPCRLRHALDATDEGEAHLPAHEEPPRRTAASRAFQAGVDGEVSRHRGR